MDSADLGAVLAGSLDGFRAVVSVEQLSGGASQRTFRVVIDTEDGEQELAVRLASDASALEDDALPLTTEAELMTTTRSAGVPGPEVIHVLGPEDGLGDGFVMRWVDGETIGSRINHQDRFASIRPELAAQCGEALARIHSTDLEATGLGRRLETIPPPDLIQRTWDDYRTLGVAMPMIDFAGRWLSENLPRSEELRLVHGDFRNGNLIIDADAGIVAVLDWELAHIGDPMRDLGWVCTRSWRYGRTDLEVGGFGTVDDLLDGYESVSGGTIDREDLRYWEVFGSFWWAVACLRLADTHRSGADSSVERPAIGRRSSEAQIDLVALLIPGPVQLAEPVDDSADDDLPTTTALVGSVADHLADHLAATSGGRDRFLARVSANALGIVRRELELGPPAREREHERLHRLLDREGSVVELRSVLAEALGAGEVPLDTPGLAEHLRATVADRVTIDQPEYPGLVTALAFDR